MNPKIDNPYSPHTPISDMAKFHGREDEIEETMYRVISPQPQSVSIVGPEGIGKSSLMNVLTSEEIRKEFFPQSDEYICASMRFAEGDSPASFYAQVGGLIAETYPDLSDFRREPDPTGFSDLVDNLMRKGKKLVILMDNFEIPVLSEDFPTDFFSFLRGQANNNDVAYVTATTERLADLFRRKQRRESPFYNIFGAVLLRPMSEDVVKSIVESPIKGMKSPLAEHFEEIYRLAGGFPALVHCLCSRLFGIHAERGQIRDTDLEKASSAVAEECDNYLHGLWEDLSDEEQLASEKLLRRERLDGLQEAFRSIEEKGCLYVDPQTGKSVLFPDLLRRHVARALKI